MRIHPVAALFPMMDGDELADLAADIKANGLIHPIIIDTVDGEEVQIDGRNRRRACEMSGVEPRFEQLNGRDPVALILSNNLARRQMTKGQIAITIARVRLLGSNNSTQEQMATVHGVHRSALAQAEVIVRHASELADQVLARTETFDSAYGKARIRKVEAESNEEKMMRLRKHAPDLADLADMSLDEAIARLDRRQADEALLVTIEDEAPDLVTLVREGRMSVQDAMAAFSERQDVKEAAQDGATRLLARAIALLDFPGKDPKQRAADLMANVTAKMWPEDQKDEFTSTHLNACGEILIECACILKARETPEEPEAPKRESRMKPSRRRKPADAADQQQAESAAAASTH